MKHPPLIKILILNYLVNNGKLTGYEFLKYCKENKISASSGNVYPQLKKLLEEGLVKYKKDGKRKIYTLTSKGDKVVKNSVLGKAPEMIKKTIFKNMLFNSKLDFNNPNDIKKVIDILDKLKNQFEQHLINLQNGG